MEKLENDNNKLTRLENRRLDVEEERLVVEKQKLAVEEEQLKLEQECWQWMKPLSTPVVFANEWLKDGFRCFRCNWRLSITGSLSLVVYATCTKKQILIIRVRTFIVLWLPSGWNDCHVPVLICCADLFPFLFVHYYIDDDWLIVQMFHCCQQCNGYLITNRVKVSFNNYVTLRQEARGSARWAWHVVTGGGRGFRLCVRTHWSATGEFHLSRVFN